jgi:hypothetical protein
MAAFSTWCVAPPARDPQRRARALRTDACFLDMSELWQLADSQGLFAIRHSLFAIRHKPPA